MFKPSKRLIYSILEDLGRLDLDLDSVSAKITDSIESCLLDLAVTEAVKREFNSCILVMDKEKQFMAWTAYPLLACLGLNGSLHDYRKVVALLSLELHQYARRFPEQAIRSGLELDRDGNLYLHSTARVVGKSETSNDDVAFKKYEGKHLA